MCRAALAEAEAELSKVQRPGPSLRQRVFFVGGGGEWGGSEVVVGPCFTDIPPQVAPFGVTGGGAEVSLSSLGGSSGSSNYFEIAPAYSIFIIRGRH